VTSACTTPARLFGWMERRGDFRASQKSRIDALSLTRRERTSGPEPSKEFNSTAAESETGPPRSGAIDVTRNRSIDPTRRSRDARGRAEEGTSPREKGEE